MILFFETVDRHEEAPNLSRHDRILPSAAALTGIPSSLSTSGARTAASGGRARSAEEEPPALLEKDAGGAVGEEAREASAAALGGAAGASAQHASMASRALASARAPGPPREPATGGSGLPRSAAGAR